MNFRVLLLVFLIGCSDFMVGAAPKQNYGAEAGKQLVIRANALFNKGKYAEAKVLYEQALATGDKFYAKKCTEQLQAINTLLRGKQQKKQRTQRATVFTISQDTVKINYLGGDYPIHVNGENWNATIPNEDWCKIDIDRKTGIVKIFSSPNESTDSRSTLITIKNGNGQKKTVEVINEGAPEILRSSAQSLVFTPLGETNVVDIDANTEWNVADVPEWLKAIKGADNIQFTANANDDNKDRIAQVKVETPSRQEITINIIQGARLDSLAFSKNDLHFGQDGGDEYIQVLTDADDWRFGSFPHWCQLERIDSNTIKVHCTPNEPVDMPREASINVTTGNQTLGINVFQAPKPIVHIIPTDGIGGRRISFGFRAGYINPFIATNASSKPILSPVNYMQGTETPPADYKSSGGFNVGAFADIRLYKNLYLNAGVDFLYYKYKNEFSGDMKLNLPGNNDTQRLIGEGLGSFKEEYTMMTIDIPVLASYRIPITKKSHIRINAGPVLSIGLSSELDLSGRTNSESLLTYKVINGKISNEPINLQASKHHCNYVGDFNMYSDMAHLTTTSAYGNNSRTPPSDDKMDAVPYNRFNFGLRFGVGYEYMGISLSLHYQWMVTNMANKNFWNGNRWTILHSNDEYHMTGYSQHNNLLMVTLGYTFRY